MNKTLLFLLLAGLLISCKPTPPSGDNGEIVPLTSECLLKNSDLYMKYPYKIKVQDSIMCIWDLHGGDRFYHLYSYPRTPPRRCRGPLHRSVKQKVGPFMGRLRANFD